MNFLERFAQSKIDEVKDWKNPDREETPMACPEIAIEGITKDVYAKLEAQAIAAGAEFDGAHVSLRGLVFDWNYDEASATLHATCTSKPFYVTCELVETNIRKLVENTKEEL